jgi:hypothetical protein
MTKKELIKKYNEGKLKPIASTHITNNMSIAILHIEHGIDDKVFGYLATEDKKQFFFVKLKYLTEKVVFNVGKLRFDINDFIRV